MIVVVTLSIVAVLMTGELWLSRRNERRLMQQGAVPADDPAYATMRWAYPAAFVMMALEGMVVGPPPLPIAMTGVATMVAAKLLKYWAMASLGERWTYRVIVLPGVPLVASGPYRFIRHPNYVGVVGELLGMALLTGAWVMGPTALVCFSWLLARRIRAEEKAIY